MLALYVFMHFLFPNTNMSYKYNYALIASYFLVSLSMLHNNHKSRNFLNMFPKHCNEALQYALKQKRAICRSLLVHMHIAGFCLGVRKSSSSKRVTKKLRTHNYCEPLILLQTAFHRNNTRQMTLDIILWQQRSCNAVSSKEQWEGSLLSQCRFEGWNI